MKISYRSYPHPVLSYFSDDLVRCAFQATVTVDTSQTYFRVNVMCQLSSKDLRSLIDTGQAAYAIHVECSATRYRRIALSSDSDFTFEIPASAAQGTVDICVLVCATQPIQTYANTNFHSDYAYTRFSVSKGDVLAVAEDRTFLADNERDQLRRIPSIFEVARTTDPDAATMDIDLMGNKITIQLKTEDYDRYSSLVPAAHLESVIASLIAVPALIEALESVKSAEDADQDFGNYRWYRVIKSKLASEGVDLSSGEFPTATVALTQRLLETPVSEALKTIQSIAEEE